VLLSDYLSEVDLTFVPIWIIGLIGESVPPVRAFQKDFIGQYKWFYSYLMSVLARDACLFTVYFARPKSYPTLYWRTEFIGVVLGCGLVWEAYKIALASYPGSARMARSLLALVFIFTFGRFLVKNWSAASWTRVRTALDLELDLRVVQVALLFALVALFAYYAIPLGKNLKGIVYGYGLFLVTSLVNLTLRGQLGDSFQRVWQYMQPGCYMLVLAIWTWSLWSYRPVPKPKVQPELELHYAAFMRATRVKLLAARDRLARGTRI